MDKITKLIFDTCYDFNKNENESNLEEARYWADVSAKRFALTVKKILEYTEGGKEVKILNASGLGSGDHDVSIVKALQSESLSFEWDVYDSTDNPYLEKQKLKEHIQELDINLIAFDYAQLTHKDDKKYDIILFTEIAEHLDHSLLLNALNYLNDKLKDNGHLIVTTPNALWFPSRFKVLFGQEGNEYYGEGNANLQKNVYGHITYFTPQRLQRLVEDCGFKKKELFTFDWLPTTDSNSSMSRMVGILISVFSSLISNTKGTIFFSATKEDSNKEKIPFAV